MKINFRKAYEALYSGEKMPRKTKKAILGRKVGSATLKKMIKESICTYRPATMFEMPTFRHGMFCPKCGCTGMQSTGNKATYPEHWEMYNCYRCGYLVGIIDNSPFYHVLEYGGEWYI